MKKQVVVEIVPAMLSHQKRDNLLELGGKLWFLLCLFQTTLLGHD